MHCIHVGYVGVELNILYDELADFVLGWFGADICADDGRNQQPAQPPKSTTPAHPQAPTGEPIEKPLKKPVKEPPAKLPRPEANGLERPNSPSF
jgi:hypothetical protein